MAKSYTNVKKLIDKAKRKALAAKLGTCKLYSPATLANTPEDVRPTIKNCLIAGRSELPMKAGYVIGSDRRYRYR